MRAGERVRDAARPADDATPGLGDVRSVECAGVERDGPRGAVSDGLLPPLAPVVVVHHGALVGDIVGVEIYGRV